MISENDSADCETVVKDLAVERQSSVFRFVSLLGMIAVIIWHSECGSRMEKWVVPVFTHWSVPWFFFLSARFYKESIKKYGLRGVLRKKGLSLAVPYVLWCLIGWCLWTPAIGGGWIKATMNLFAIGTCFPAGNWPLWYTRALMEYMFVFGVCQWLFGLAGKGSETDVAWGPVSLFVAFCLTLRVLGVRFSPFGDFLFFLSGLCVPQGVVTKVMGSRRGMVILCAGSVMLWPCVLLTTNEGVRFVCENVGIAFMILILLKIVRAMPMGFLNNRTVVSTCMLTPLVYFSHGPIMRGAIKCFFGENEGVLHAGNLAFIAQALIFPPLIYIIAGMIRKYGPSTCRVLSGGRL